MNDVPVKAEMNAKSLGLGSNCSHALNGSHSEGGDDCQSSPPSRAPVTQFNQSNSFRPNQ